MAGSNIVAVKIFFLFSLKTIELATIAFPCDYFILFFLPFKENNNKYFCN